MNRLMWSLAVTAWAFPVGVSAQGPGAAGRPPKPGPPEGRRVQLRRAVQAVDRPAPEGKQPRNILQAPKALPRRAVAVQVADRAREVIQLKHLPAAEAAETVAELLRDEHPPRGQEVVIVPEMAGNRLLLSGAPAMVKQAVGLVSQIDTPPKSVAVEAVLAELSRENGAEELVPTGGQVDLPPEAFAKLVETLKKSPHCQLLAQMKVTAVDGEPAFIQVGQRVPTARTVHSKKGRPTGTPYENTGLILGVKARVSGEDRVVMEIDVEKSEAGDRPAGADGTARAMNVITAQTTVAAKCCHAVVLGGLAVRAGTETRELVLIVRPKIVPP